MDDERVDRELGVAFGELVEAVRAMKQVVWTTPRGPASDAVEALFEFLATQTAPVMRSTFDRDRLVGHRRHGVGHVLENAFPVAVKGLAANLNVRKTMKSAAMTLPCAMRLDLCRALLSTPLVLPRVGCMLNRRASPVPRLSRA
jgi:hypothetical protein